MQVVCELPLTVEEDAFQVTSSLRREAALRAAARVCSAGSWSRWVSEGQHHNSFYSLQASLWALFAPTFHFHCLVLIEASVILKCVFKIGLQSSFPLRAHSLATVSGFGFCSVNGSAIQITSQTFIDFTLYSHAAWFSHSVSIWLPHKLIIGMEV